MPRTALSTVAAIATLTDSQSAEAASALMSFRVGTGEGVACASSVCHPLADLRGEA